MVDPAVDETWLVYRTYAREHVEALDLDQTRLLVNKLIHQLVATKRQVTQLEQQLEAAQHYLKEQEPR